MSGGAVWYWLHRHSAVPNARMPESSESRRTRALAAVTVVADASEAEDIAVRVEKRWNCTTAVIQRPGGRRAWVEMYFERDIDAFLAAIALRDQPGVIAAQPRRFEARDWVNFWKGRFRTLDVGARLRIQPVWEKRRPVPRGRVRIWLDPGLSFGTGEHFTTRFCLEQIDRLVGEGICRSVLDVGTGSGILAIAAVKLGAPAVAAFDCDPQAIRHARANARLNRVENRVRFSVRDLTQSGPPKRRFDLVCANVYSRLLTGHAADLANGARRFLVLSGIREAEADAVANVYAALGMDEVARDGDGEWAGLVFSWPNTCTRSRCNTRRW